MSKVLAIFCKFSAVWPLILSSIDNYIIFRALHIFALQNHLAEFRTNIDQLSYICQLSQLTLNFPEVFFKRSRNSVVSRQNFAEAQRHSCTERGAQAQREAQRQRQEAPDR